MKTTIPQIIPAMLLWLIIGAGMFLRIHNGDYFPIHQNDDGPFYVWLGNSILDDFFHPSSLTIFETDNHSIFWRSQYRDLDPVNRFGYKLTDQYFDHPFIASFFIALPARFFGYTGFSQIPQFLVRTPAFISALITLILTYILASKLAGKWVGIMSTAILAFWPLAVFAHRQSYLENMISPLFLLSLLAIWHLEQHYHRSWLIILILTCIMAGWTKFVGYTLFGFVLYRLYLNRQVKLLHPVAIALTVSIITYLLYGWWIGGSQFWWSLAHQGSRGAYLGSILTYISSPQIQGYVQDSWWYLGLLGLAVMAAIKSPRYQLVGMAAFLWLLATFLIAGKENTSPWYLYPIYPLLAISAAIMIHRTTKINSLFGIILLVILGLAGWHVAGIALSGTIIRASTFIILAVWLVAQQFPQNIAQIINRGLVIILLTLSFAGNVLVVRRVPQQVCGLGGCVQPDKIQLPTP